MVAGNRIFILIDGTNHREDDQLLAFPSPVAALVAAQRLASRQRHERSRQYEESAISPSAKADGWLYLATCTSHDEGESIAVREVEVVS